MDRARARSFPGYGMGDEGNWDDWVVGHGPGSGTGLQFVENYFRYMVAGDTKVECLDS